VHLRFIALLIISYFRSDSGFHTPSARVPRRSSNPRIIMNPGLQTWPQHTLGTSTDWSIDPALYAVMRVEEVVVEVAVVAAAAGVVSPSLISMIQR